MKTLPCIVCGKKLEDAFPNIDESDNTPYEGLAFESRGNYGSKVFDPGDSSYLEVNICDDCIRTNQDKILYGRVLTAREIRLEPWDGKIG